MKARELIDHLMKGDPDGEVIIQVNTLRTEKPYTCTVGRHTDIERIDRMPRRSVIVVQG